MYRLKPGQELILASASPRRKELLADCGLNPRIVASGCDEDPVADETAIQMVERLAREKARAVAVNNEKAWVLAADTTVVIDGCALGKPADSADAARMLRTISAREHEVLGGICLLNRAAGVQEVETHSTRVTMRELSSADIGAFVASGEPLDKAGSYAIQGVGANLVDAINGSYTNVVGLNVAAVISLLLKHGVIEV